MAQDVKSVYLDINVYRYASIYQIPHQNVTENLGALFNGIGLGYQATEKSAFNINFLRTQKIYDYFVNGNYINDQSEIELSFGWKLRTGKGTRFYPAWNLDLITRFSKSIGSSESDLAGTIHEFNHNGFYIGAGLGVNLNYRLTRELSLFGGTRITFGHITVSENGLMDENNFIRPGYDDWYWDGQLLNAFGIRMSLNSPKETR